MLAQLRDCLLQKWPEWSLGSRRPRDLAFIAHGVGATKLCWYVFDESGTEPCLVARMPRSPRGNAALAHEYDLIHHLRQHGSDFVRETVPGPLSTVTIAGHLVGIERYLPGVPMDSQLARLSDGAGPESSEHLDSALRWLLRSQLETPSQRAPLTDQHVYLHCLTPIARLRATARLTDAEEAFLDRLEKRISGLVGWSLPLVFTHGDFQPANILVEGDSLRVIDWEFGERMTLPLLDVFGLLARTHARRHAIEEIDGYLEDYLDAFEAVFFADGLLGKDAVNHVDQACATLDVDPVWLDVLFALFLITEANKYYAFLRARADSGYVYLLRSRTGQAEGSYRDQLARQKHVWLLGHLAQNAKRLAFGPRSIDEPLRFVR